MYDKLAAYEGRENYIFISYSHRDTEKVLPIMEKLHDLGCRIWYDEGIAPGSEWPEDIARHLNDSAMVIAFVSPNSMASVNCRREINFALSKQKPFLSVVLEPTEMPLGMELQLSAQQSVLRYNFRTEEQFIEKICSCPDLAPCKEIPKQPKPVEVTKPVHEANPVTVPATVPKKTTPAAAIETEQVKTQKPKGNKLLVFAAVAAVLVCLFAFPKNSAPENPAGSTEAPVSQTQPAETEGTELVVRVKIPKSWTSACLWAWSDPSGEEAYDEWPGLSLEKGADGWYIGTVPSWVNRVSVVSGDGQGESAHVALHGRDIWIIVREDWTCQTSDNGPFVATIKIRASVDTWEDPHCWAWTANGDVFEAWPGEAMTTDGRWYIIDIPYDTIGIKLSDPTTGAEIEDLLLEPGWDVWVYERGGYYLWDYQEISEDSLKESFRSVGVEY